MTRRSLAESLGVMLVALTTACANDATTRAVRLTQAEVRTTQSTGFTSPPSKLPSADLAAPERFLPASLPYAPVTVRAPRERRTQGEVATSITWVRVAVPDAVRGPGPRALYLPRWKSDGTLAIYGDGDLLYRSHSNLMWNGYNHPLWIPIDDAPPREILVRMQHLDGGGGGALSSLWFGAADDLYWRYFVRGTLQNQLPAMSSAAFLALGVFSLGVWLWRRKEPLYLLFAAMAGLSWLRTLHYHVGLERLPLSDAWFGWLTVNSLFWFMTVTHAFLERMHQHPKPRLTLAVYVTAALCSLVTLPLPGFPDATLTSPLCYVVLIVFGITAFSSDLWHSHKVRSNSGMLLSGWSLAGTFFGLHDWLLQNNLLDIESVFLAPYASIGAFFLFTYTMFRRYVDAIDTVERAHQDMETRLQQREVELTASHRRLAEIEQRNLLGKERERMMQDMHDGLGSSLRTALWAAEHGKLDDATVAEVLKGCIDDLKLAIDSMDTADPDLLLLLATWRFRLEPRLSGTGIRLRWEVRDVPPLPWLDPKNALHILRILQETLTNIIKHARATEVRVSTGILGGTLGEGVFVQLEDNGKGFDPSETPSKGRGLENQQRRARAIGGRLELHSSSTGTSVRLWLPLQNDAGLAQASLVGVARED